MDPFEVKKSGKTRYYILALITMLFVLSAADRSTLSVAGPSMSKELGLSPVDMGWLFSAFAWAYVIFMIPAGRFIDFVGVKKGVLLGLLIWSLATALMGGVGGLPAGMVFGTLVALRFLLGVFETPIGPASGRVIAGWFPGSERGVAGAILNSYQYLSLAIFTPFMGWLANQYSWHFIYFVMGGLGVLAAIVWGRLFHVPRSHPSLSKEEFRYMAAGGAIVDMDQGAAGSSSTKASDSKRSTGKDLKELFSNRMFIGIFIGQYCINAITWFFMSWFPAYLVKEHHLTILTAGFVAIVPAICGFVGGVLSGFVSDRILKKTGSLSLARKIPITIGLLLSTAIIGCNYAVGNVTLVVCLMGLAFFGKGFGSLGWTVVADTAPKEIVGLTGGVFNAIGNCSGIITPVVIGYILSTTGGFVNAIWYVGIHGLVAVFSYWFIVGKIQRVQLRSENVAKTPQGDTLPT